MRGLARRRHRFLAFPAATNPKDHQKEPKDASAMIAISPLSHAIRFPNTSNERATRAAASRQEAMYDAELVRRFRNRADAEEIAQDTFVRAHRGLAGFRGDSSLATWLFRIAVNLSRNRYRYF